MQFQPLVLSFLLSGLFFSFSSYSQLELQKHWYQTYGDIYDIEIDEENNTVYVGGDFNSFGLMESRLFLSDTSGNNKLKNMSPNSGSVNTVIKDNNGGWYIGGTFTMIGDSVRQHIAHYDSEGNLTSFTANCNDDVQSLHLRNDTLFIGGQFSNVKGQSRYRFAAVNVSSGNLLPWNPSFTGTNLEINDIISFNNNLFVAGHFSSVAGQPRSNFVAFDLTTGNVDSWAPSIGGGTQGVSDLELAGDTVYFCGNITSFDGNTIDKLGAFNASTKSFINWTPNVQGGYPHSLDVLEDTIYLGGSFTSVNGLTRNKFAGINRFTNVTSSISPNFGGDVFALKVIENNIYVGGNFNTVNSATRNYFASINLTSGNLNPIEYQFNSAIFSIANENENVAFGGTFTYSEWGERNNIAALDLTTGELLPWNPNVDDIVRTLCLYEDKLYVGGDFEDINNYQRTCLASFDVLNGQLTNLAPYIISKVYAIDASDGEVFVGGSFPAVGIGIPPGNRNNLASFDATTGALTNWNPNADSHVRSLICHKTDNYVYAGGIFDQIGGQNRNVLAEIYKNSGGVSPFNTNINTFSTVESLDYEEDILYVGGNFSNIGGAPRENVAAVDLNQFTNNATNWDPSINGTVHDILVTDSVVFCGGNFSETGGQITNNISVIGKSSGNPVGISLNANNDVRSINKSGNYYFFGGDFTTLNGNSRRGFAVYKDTCNADIPTIQASNNGICPNTSVTLSISSGDLNYSSTWAWYTDGCGETFVGAGTSISVSPSTTTTYYVRGEGTCGMPDECASITVDVYNTPAPTGSANQNICLYDNATLDDLSVNGNSIQWYTSQSGGTILQGSTPVIDGETYYASQTQNGCESLSRLGVTTNFVSINNSVTQQNITLSAVQSGATYQWLNCANNYSVLPGATFKDFTPPFNGDYAVEISYNSCKDTSNCFSINTVSLNEEHDLSSIRVYPNPSKGKVYIDIKSNQTINHLKVLDTKGKVVLRKDKVNGNFTELEMNSLKNGVYYIEINTDNQKKVVKKVTLN